VDLPSDRLTLPKSADARAAYREAKSTLAVVVASAAKRRLQPIPPSADWRFDLAEGCHTHGRDSYLAGSLTGHNLRSVLLRRPARDRASDREPVGGGSLKRWDAPVQLKAGVKFMPSGTVDPNKPADLLGAVGLQGEPNDASAHRHYCLGAIH